tara:strand:+ start:27401 stop:27646 length:246 start_codon:yes stop_codon:yes gene_type:complete
MTRQVHISNRPPVITKDVLDYLKAVCDVPAKQSDNDKTIRWKAAQRDIYLKAEYQYERSMERPNTASNKAENLGINIRSED